MARSGFSQLLRLRARQRYEAAGRLCWFFSHFLDEFRHVVDLFNRDHVKLGMVLLSDCQR
jgi:hypothetical protein